MTQAIDKEWEDGDDSKLYDYGYSEGYKDGLIRVIDMLNNVVNQERINELPSSFIVSVVIGSIRELMEEKND
jgi:hypothetical protein